MHIILLIRDTIITNADNTNAYEYTLINTDVNTSADISIHVDTTINNIAILLLMLLILLSLILLILQLLMLLIIKLLILLILLLIFTDITNIN